ncbi:hypothetical protein AMATHDRAFT_134274 [Amanita thiersii Skay4041]|uniref:DUF7702 domain-containing protein n=1 Tax=Amanita thiersii Skay4041 TaxID=703135 RepID=A0A2A9NX17_9AGAR|nr:hypothetical protein AMATHDRAFT_134274 [Amanita thiersii Skay4041]
MPSLDSRGIIAVVQVAFYVPVTIITGILVFRYALRRDAGWLFLFIFSLTRITDGALIIAGTLTHTTLDLFTPAYTIQAAGIAPLILTSIGFLGLVGQHSFSETPRISHTLRILGLVTLVALGIMVAGCLLGSPVNPSKGEVGSILRKVGSCMFGALYVGVVLVHFGAFSFRWHLRWYRRKLLWGLFLALPFLGARAAYLILVTWSSSDLYGTHPSSNHILARLNPVTGDFAYYLVLSVVFEFVVTLLYLFSSTYVMRKHSRS